MRRYRGSNTCNGHATPGSAIEQMKTGIFTEASPDEAASAATAAATRSA
eukprot:CAMPEP_0183340084 /NCGR_PEP_ID=MMETSP0164_2-20130417/6757_2 /TAXON_ID=221442 /ORGANISM="Coccolithus pelagicus ssp braarudi, Strain PLY182g" /LENGTH=48 /DNA_ID= /DNA_START= /DNA_END= /DNA_ORIENTATION=